MEHFMKLQSQPFENIANQTKTIEMRLFDEKRKILKVGDKIIFSKYDNSECKISTRILGLHLFENFKELYENFDKVKLGYAKNEVANFQDMEKYYSKEEQKNYGVIAIEIEKL